MLSDIDILHATDGACASAIDRHEGFESFASLWSEYLWDELEAMTSYGSLFLRHLGMEGLTLVESGGGEGRLRRMIASMGPYQRPLRDLRSFRLAINDISGSIHAEGDPVFEMAELGRVLRHASILGSYIIGEPTFGRDQAFTVFGAHLGLAYNKLQDLTETYRFRLHADRGTPVPYAPTQQTVLEWIEFTTWYMDGLEHWIYEYAAAMPPRIEVNQISR